MNATLERALDRFLTSQGFTPKTCRHCKSHEVQDRPGMFGRTNRMWGCKKEAGLNVSLECSCNLWEEK